MNHKTKMKKQNKQQLASEIYFQNKLDKQKYWKYVRGILKEIITAIGIVIGGVLLVFIVCAALIGGVKSFIDLNEGKDEGIERRLKSLESAGKNVWFDMGKVTITNAMPAYTITNNSAW